MPNYLTKTKERDSRRANLVKRTAKLTGLSKRMIYMVIQGDRQNQEVMDVYMRLAELEEAADDIAQKTTLINQVEQTVPFN